MERPTMERTGAGYFVRSPFPYNSRTFSRRKDAEIYFQQETLRWEQRDLRRCMTCGAALSVSNTSDWCEDSATCLPEV